MTSSDQTFDLFGSLLGELGSGAALPASSNDPFRDQMRIADLMWEHVPDQAHYHGVARLVMPAIVRLAAATQSPRAATARRRLTAIVHRQNAAVDAREEAVSILLTAMKSAGIRLVLLKGAALAHLIYKAPEDRPSLDIDVLVDRENIVAAARVAESIGYVFADGYASAFTPTKHHLPEAAIWTQGFRIALEIHVDAMSPTRREHLTLEDLSGPLQEVARTGGPSGLALGHFDMLRHLAHHTFEPSQRVRLVHLFDLWRYGMLHLDSVGLGVPPRQLRHIRVAHDLVGLVFKGPQPSPQYPIPAGVGEGLLPFTSIGRDADGLWVRARLLFAPSEWWLRGFYGIPPGRSLAGATLVRHPLNIVGWVISRYVARIRRMFRRNRENVTRLRVSKGKTMKVRL